MLVRKCLLDEVNRGVDVFHGAVPQTVGEVVVLLLHDVFPRLTQQLDGPMQPAAVIQFGIHAGMVVQILAVVDCCLLDLLDGIVDCSNGGLLVPLDFRFRRPFEVGARVTSIRQRMQESWVLPRLVSAR